MVWDGSAGGLAVLLRWNLCIWGHLLQTNLRQSGHDLTGQAFWAHGGHLSRRKERNREMFLAGHLCVLVFPPC